MRPHVAPWRRLRHQGLRGDWSAYAAAKLRELQCRGLHLGPGCGQLSGNRTGNEAIHCSAQPASRGVPQSHKSAQVLGPFASPLKPCHRPIKSRSSILVVAHGDALELTWSQYERGRDGPASNARNDSVSSFRRARAFRMYIPAMRSRSITATALPETRAHFDDGDCGAFAKALAQASGSSKIWVIASAMGEPWSDEIDFEVTHLVVEHPTSSLYGDAGGWSDSSEIALRFGLDARWRDYDLHGPFDVGQLDTLFGDEDGPIDIDEAAVEEARGIIRDDPRFGLNVRTWGDLVLPLVMKRELRHVGSMDPARKRAGSYEGAGLSVSECPDEWRIIGRGHVGGPTWQLRGDGAFIDAHALNDEQSAAVLAWGEREGLVTPASMWKVTWFDDELDREMSALYASRDEALEESYEGAELSVIEGYVATRELEIKQAGGREVPSVLVRDLVLSELSSRVPMICGVWWDDELNVAAYSAPRGVIHLEGLAAWKIEPTPTERQSPEQPLGPSDQSKLAPLIRQLR